VVAGVGGQEETGWAGQTVVEVVLLLYELTRLENSTLCCCAGTLRCRDKIFGARGAKASYSLAVARGGRCSPSCGCQAT
jgi:hypothetical protein